MRSALLLSVISVALLSLFSWARHEAPQSADREIELGGVDEESALFV